MTRIKHIVAMLALIGSFGTAVASEALQVADQAVGQEIGQASVDFHKDKIEFMEDNQLSEVQGTFSYKDVIKHFYCAFSHPSKASFGKAVRNCIRHY